MPSLDVGYICCKDDVTQVDEDKHWNRLNKTTENLVKYFNYELYVKEHGSLLKSSIIAHLVLSPENNYNPMSTIVSTYNSKSKFYSGQKVYYEHLNEYDKCEDFDQEYLKGYAVPNLPWLPIPDITATLRLKVNGIVLNFKNIIDNKFGRMDIYIVDISDMDNGQVGCHAVPDQMKHPSFEDFYEKRYKTYLLMFDENTNDYIKVNNITSLESNFRYICTLNLEPTNSVKVKSEYIKETEFIIQLISSTSNNSNIWIIFVVSVTIILLLIIGLIIFRKLQLKKKNSSNSLSTSTSSQSTSTSSTIISDVSNIPIIQKKNVATKSTNMQKTMANKNLNTNNKMTNLKQKVAATNSNLNLVNQAVNGPKKVVEKNTNHKKISKTGDSVFKLK
uniref:Ig-like domain-containing protein n=1 Tax=Strongyloides papillosus TaxID=174720 RepID=A0A0N5CGB5_STREA